MEELDIFFPFNFIIDPTTSIIHTGPSLRGLLPELDIGVMLDQIFSIMHPTIAIDFEDIRKHSDILFKLQALKLDKLVLKGQFVDLPKVERLLFIGSPWVTNNESIFGLGLSLKDFAIHDSAPDLVIQTYGLTKSLEDAQELTKNLGSLNKQLEQRVTERTQQLADTNSMLQETMKQNEMILQAAGEGIFGIDKGGIVTFVNPAATQILGWNIDEIMGQYQHTLFHHTRPDGSNYPNDECPIYKSLREGNVQHIDDEVFWRKDGSSFAVEYVSTPIDDDGELTGAVVVFSDITERKHIEEELIKSGKLKSVGILAGGIAHDFNNVLTGLFGNIELAKLNLSPDHAAYDNIQNAGQALDKGTSLTNQLLTFAKGGEPILEMINIGQIIQDSTKLSLSGSNVKATLILPDDLWQVNADKGQLSQVITNLVINAAQAMPAGGILTIKGENIGNINKSIALQLSGDVVKISFVDEGSGMSVENLKLIFDPYFTTKESGNGLGLATVHSIITKHKGHITADSELGTGTTFTLYLLAAGSVPKVANVTSADVIEKSDFMAGHILVMDDDEMILGLSTEIMERFGYTVDTAVDGKEAIEKYILARKSGKAFDVVIMDLTIPGGMGGKDAIKELLTLDPEVKVIVSSGYSTDPIMANYSEYGFKGRLVKPFKMDELQKELSLQIGSE